MVRWLAAAVVLLAAPAPAVAAGPLERFAPVPIHDARTASPFDAVQNARFAVPGGRRRHRRSPGRLRARSEAGSSSTGCLRPTTRRIVASCGPAATRATGSSCRSSSTPAAGRSPSSPPSTRAPSAARRTVERDGGTHPRIYVANGSHAGYFRPGTRDRMWPDPNDEARGDGVTVVPEVVPVTEDAPAWMAYDGRWGATRAGFVPGEMDSPRGPAFQPQGRWSDPAAWAAGAKSCTRRDCDDRGECDGRETAIAAVLAGFGLLWALWMGLRRMRRAELQHQHRGEGRERGRTPTLPSMQAVDVRRHHRGDEVRLRLAQRRHRSAIHSPVHPPQSPGLQQHPPLPRASGARAPPRPPDRSVDA